MNEMKEINERNSVLSPKETRLIRFHSRFKRPITHPSKKTKQLVSFISLPCPRLLSLYIPCSISLIPVLWYLPACDAFILAGKHVRLGSHILKQSQRLFSSVCSLGGSVGSFLRWGGTGLVLSLSMSSTISSPPSSLAKPHLLPISSVKHFHVPRVSHLSPCLLYYSSRK